MLIKLAAREGGWEQVSPLTNNTNTNSSNDEQRVRCPKRLEVDLEALQRVDQF